MFGLFHMQSSDTRKTDTSFARGAIIYIVMYATVPSELRVEYIHKYASVEWDAVSSMLENDVILTYFIIKASREFNYDSNDALSIDNERLGKTHVDTKIFLGDFFFSPLSLSLSGRFWEKESLKQRK